MTPLERAAKATYEWHRAGSPPTWSEIDAGDRKIMMDHFRAGLEALMEPTIDMAVAGRDASEGGLFPHGAVLVWQAMLKEAMK